MAQKRDTIQVHIENKEYSVVGGGFQEMLAAVKQINGRRFVGQLKVWQLPGTVDEIKNQLDISGFQLEGGQPVSQPELKVAAEPPPPGNDRIRLSIQGKPVTMVGGAFREMLAAVKSLPERRFDGNSKVWQVGGNPATVKQMIEEAGFTLEGIEAALAAEGNDSAGVTPPVGGPVEAPPFEPPDFGPADDTPPYEPPDWWDDDNAPPPPMEPPDWWDDDAGPPPDFNAPPPDFDEPPPALDMPAQSSPTPAKSAGNDQIRMRIGGIPFVVAGGDFREMLTVVKALPNRRFNGEEKLWEIPAEVTIEGVKKQVEAAGFSLTRD